MFAILPTHKDTNFDATDERIVKNFDALTPPVQYVVSQMFIRVRYPFGRVDAAEVEKWRNSLNIKRVKIFTGF